MGRAFIWAVRNGARPRQVRPAKAVKPRHSVALMNGADASASTGQAYSSQHDPGSHSPVRPRTDRPASRPRLPRPGHGCGRPVRRPGRRDGRGHPAGRRRRRLDHPPELGGLYGRRARDLEHPLCPADEDPAGARLRRLYARSGRAGPEYRRHPRFRGDEPQAAGPDRLDCGLRARTGAGGRFLRPSGPPPLRLGSVYPQAGRARLSARARRVPRRLRPCADAH
uniref:LigA n=1 Tax=Parastrongyloides trichosuri TaxID=131310 RepID=A0A0N5A030_PARTI